MRIVFNIFMAIIVFVYVTIFLEVKSIFQFSFKQ